MKRAAIGVRAHSGWAALVVVSADEGAIEVIDRRRIGIVDPGMRGASQPYHFAQTLNLSEARKYLKTCAAVCERLSVEAIRDVVHHLKRNYDVTGCGMLLASGRHLQSLAEILSSHPLIHTAEGEFFRNAIRCACERVGIPVSGYRERELTTNAKALFGRRAEHVQQSIAMLGRSLGPPWTSDQKTAALAACLLLAEGNKKS